jgi:GNAT superfamily N-acetyltransferase
MSGIRITDATTPEALAALYGAVGWKHKSDVALCRQALAQTSVVIAAHDGDRLAGIARLASDGTFVAHLMDMAVHPDYQKRGIGGLLAKRMIQYCKDRGFETHRGELTLFAARGVDKFYSTHDFQNAGNGMYYLFQHYRKERKTAVIRKPTP